MLHLCVCFWVSMDDDPQGWTAAFECGVVFPALLSAGLRVFTTDVWWLDPDWLPDAHPAAPGVSVSLFHVSRSVPLALPCLLGSFAVPCPGFPGTEGLSRALCWGCCSSVRSGSSRQSPSAPAAATSWHLHPGTGRGIRALSLTGEGFIPVLQHLLLAVGHQACLALAEVVAVLLKVTSIKASCGTPCRCKTSREEQLCLQAVSSQAVLAKHSGLCDRGCP